MTEPPNFQQELTACFGQPVSENPTQVMIEAAYLHHGLDWRYLTIEVAPDGLAAAVAGARAMGFAGFNCTIPHKIAVIEHLDGPGESASVMGAVNCVVKQPDGRLIGENTDGKGFVGVLEEVRSPVGTKVVIFGAGGAARAIGVELALAGATDITIVNRSAERGSALARLLNEKTPATTSFVPWEGDFSVEHNTDIVVNATSIGLFPDIDARLAVDVSTLNPEMIVADVIPNPPTTRLIRDATARGCTTLDGLGMLVGQGVIGIKHWTGIEPEASVMRKALVDIFGA